MIYQSNSGNNVLLKYQTFETEPSYVYVVMFMKMLQEHNNIFVATASVGKYYLDDFE